MSSRVCLLILLATLFDVETHKLPDYLQKLRCSPKSDLRSCFIKSANLASPLIAKAKFLEPFRCSVKKDLDICFVKNANKAIPLVVQGIPEYKIPKLNPFSISFVQLISSPTLGLNLTNVKIYGFENMKLKNYKFNWVKLVFTYGFHCEKIKIEGDYIIDGKIMVLPIKGDGPFSLYLYNGIYNLTTSGTAVERNGEKYYHVVESRLNYHFDKIKFEFNNLFDGNRKLGDEINKFLNENWEPLLVDFGPGIANTISSSISALIETFLIEIPHSEIFLD